MAFVLDQVPGPWLALIVTAITLMGTLTGVILEQRLIQKSKRDYDFFQARRKAYYNYMVLFSSIDEKEEHWSKEFISKLWSSALEAGEFGNLRANISYSVKIGTLIKNFDELCMETDILIHFRFTHLMFHEEKFMDNSSEFALKDPYFFSQIHLEKEIKPSQYRIYINSLYDLIVLLELLQLVDPSSINKKYLIEKGRAFFPAFRYALLKNKRKNKLWFLYNRF